MVKRKVKKGLVVTGCLILVLSLASWAVAGVNPVKVLVNGEEVAFDQAPVILKGRVLVPIRAVLEKIGAEVAWDGTNRVVSVSTTQGDEYLSGKNDPHAAKPDIHTNFVKAADLLAVLDDDKDSDLCDYRAGQSGGDSIANDPLVLDVRKKTDYDAGHIPGAVWIAFAGDMGKVENIKALRDALDAHVAKGGKNEVVVACYTAHTAGLVCGVLGTHGFNAKNLRFGYSISWEGTKQADLPIYGPREDKDGKLVSASGKIKSELTPEKLPTPDKCANCHNIASIYQEISASAHKNLKCFDCHVPGGVQKAKYASKDCSFNRLGYYEGEGNWVEVRGRGNEVCLRCHAAHGKTDTAVRCWSCHMHQSGTDQIRILKDKTKPATLDNIREIKEVPHVSHSFKSHP